VINYGEVDKDSLTKLGLKTPYLKLANKQVYTSTTPGYKNYPVAERGSIVKAGQQIAMIGILPQRSSMLHIEFYSLGTKFNKKWKNFPDGSPPPGLLDPTNYLVALSDENARIPTREVQSESVCR